MESDPSPGYIKSLAKSIVDTYNKYLTEKRNNMFKFAYCVKITEDVSNSNSECIGSLLCYERYCVFCPELL